MVTEAIAVRPLKGEDSVGDDPSQPPVVTLDPAAVQAGTGVAGGHSLNFRCGRRLA